MARLKKTLSMPPAEALTKLPDFSEFELRFIDEFLIDRDAMQAGLRAGIARIQLKKKVQQLMGDPKIVRAIQLKTDGMEIEKMISPQRIIAGFIDVAFDRSANHAARNSALRELAALKQMYPEKENENDGKSGVLLVPAIGSLEDWVKASTAQQAKLKEDVRK